MKKKKKKKKKKKTRKYDNNTFSDMTKQTIFENVPRQNVTHKCVRVRNTLCQEHSETENPGTETFLGKESLRQLELSDNLTMAPLQRYSMLM